MVGRPRGFDTEAVITAAMDAFWSKGYEATSAQDLVDSTGLGRGSLYGAFGSKENLYRRALEQYLDISITRQREVLGGNDAVIMRLRRLMEWGIDNDLVHDADRSGCMALYAWFERISQDPVVQEISQKYINSLEKILTEMFADARRTGEISSVISDLKLARGFMSSYFGMRLLGRSVRDRSFLTDVVDGVIAGFSH